MKKFTPIFISFCLLSTFGAQASDVIFEEYFSSVTEVFYGNTVLPANDYDTYFDNAGWTGENVVLGGGAAAGAGPIYNEISKPRVSFWQGANDHLTTPTINCPMTVLLTVDLKRACRYNDGTKWDYAQAKVLHAPDGVNFELVQTVNLPQNTAADPHSFTNISFAITNATANSKFRFQVVQKTEPNRFFVGSVVVKNLIDPTNIENSKVEGNVIISSNEISVKNNAHVTIYNALGAIVYDGNSTTIDLQNFSNGLYILQADALNGNVETIKFMKK